MIGDVGVVIVHSWVEVTRGCEFRYNTRQGNGASFTIDGKPEPFEIFFDTEALRRFVECGTAALAELDTPHAPES